MEKHYPREISEKRRIKESKRFDSLEKGYKKFCECHVSSQTKEVICLNRVILAGVVRSYFDDIERFKEYTKSEYADRHKQAAYTIKWIAKLKPIQIKIDKEGDEIYQNMPQELMEINARFALYVAMVLFLDAQIISLMSKKIFDHLVYTAMFRDISGRQLALSLYLMERIVECYNRKPNEKFEM
ncbi:MAG: hypothetical protein LBF55_01060 [Prevotellaceae bacterium]|jgi:hypothetical protein|nr:hypothetical protein [Prevotellaceae bacterium]